MCGISIGLKCITKWGNIFRIGDFFLTVGKSVIRMWIRMMDMVLEGVRSTLRPLGYAKLRDYDERLIKNFMLFPAHRGR